MTGNICWITGASSGIGRELGLRLSERGWHVVASARNAEALEALSAAASRPGSITSYVVDVTDREGMKQGLEKVVAQQGEVGLAVLNAGDYRPMPAREFDADLCQHLIEVNYLGVVNGIAAVLPRMLEQGRGQILINASVAGYRGLPLAGAYGASKAALISLAESLRAELEGSGVAIRVINPGFVKTGLTAQNPFKMPALLTTAQAAESIIRGLDKTDFEITFPVRFTYFLKLLRALPYRFYFPLIRRVTGIGV